MRYRALTPDGDMTFGRGAANFLVNSPECVAQAVLTALRLIQGEWFLDTSAGVPYSTQVLGNVRKAEADQTMQQAMLGVQGVTEIVSYSSDVTARKFSLTATLNTLYGAVTIQTVVP